jgi:hypothetical protein
MSESNEKLMRGLVLFLITAAFFFALRYPPPFSGHTLSYPAGSDEHVKAIIKIAMQVLVSIGTGIPAVFIILAKRYGPKEKHWAYGTVGLIAGYWLR